MKESKMKTYRVNFLKGQLPGDQAQSWMTEEDWKKFYEYVEQLKREGEYLKPDYVDISYPEDIFNSLRVPTLPEGQSYLSNFGMFIPQSIGINKKPAHGR